MRRSIALLVLLGLTPVGLTLSPAPAAAAPSEITASVSKNGLAFIGDVVPSHLPKGVALAGWTKTLLGCPFSSKSAYVALTDIKASFDVTALDITPNTNKVTVDLSARVYAGSAKASFNVCIGSTVTCSVSFSVSSASATTSFEPVVYGGKVELRNPSVALDLPSNKVAVAFSGCGLVSALANKALPYAKSYLLGKLQDTLENVAKKTVPPEVEKALAAFTSYSGTMQGFKVGAKLAQVSTSSAALTAGIDATISTTKTASCSLPSAPYVSKTTSSPYLGSHSEHLGVAISESAIKKAINAAWKSGLLCFSDSKLKSLGVGNAAGTVGVLLGLDKTKSLEIKAPKAPKIALLSGSLGRVNVTIPIEARLVGERGGTSATVIAKTDVEVEARLRVDGGSSALVLDVTKLDIGAVSLSSTSSKVVLPDAKLLESALKVVALLPLRAQLDGYALVPQVLHQTGGALDDYYLYIARRANTTKHLKLYANLYRAPSSDKGRPYTYFSKKPGAVIGANAFIFRASGGDSGTPKALLRYRWRVDGGSWSSASYGTSLRKRFKTGNHLVEVKAVDLAGNTDSTPAKASFEVDAISPALSLQSGPPALLEKTATTIVVGIGDNVSAQGAIATRLQLEKITPAGPVLVQDLPFVKGKTRYTLSNLALGGDYSALLWARDEAGNVSQQLLVRFLRGTPGGNGNPSNPPPPSGDDPPTGGSNNGGNAGNSNTGSGSAGSGNAGSGNASSGGGSGTTLSPDPIDGGGANGGAKITGGCSVGDGHPGHALPLAVLGLLGLLGVGRTRREKRG